MSLRVGAMEYVFCIVAMTAFLFLPIFVRSY